MSGVTRSALGLLGPVSVYCLMGPGEKTMDLQVITVAACKTASIVLSLKYIVKVAGTLSDTEAKQKHTQKQTNK